MNTGHCLPAWILFVLVAWLPGPTAALADDFKPGAYSHVDKDGVKVWDLYFTQDAKVPSRYNVTGTVGSVVRVPVTGNYNVRTNKLSANWAAIPGTPFGLADINGEWRAEQNEFVVRYAGGPSIKLHFDSSAPDPAAMKLAIKDVHVEPPVNGALLKGHFTLVVSQFRDVHPMSLWLTVEHDHIVPRPSRGIGRLHVSGDGEHVIDFALAPVMVPQETDAVVVTVSVYSQDADPTSVESKQLMLASSQTRPVMVESFTGMVPAGPVAAERVGEIGWTYGLRSIVDATGHKVRAKVFETVTITSEDRPGEAITLPPAEYELPCSPDAEVMTRHTLPALDLKPGDYHAVVRIEGPDVQTYNGVFSFFIKAPARKNDPEPAPATLAGSATMGKSTLKPGEQTTLAVKYGFDQGPDPVDADVDIEIVDPDGKITSSRKRVVIRPGKPVQHNFNVDSKTPGVHTVRVRVNGEKCNPWTTSTTFNVEQPATPSVQGQPQGDQQGNAGEQGTFGLVSKVVGKGPGPGEGPYGIATAEINQTSCNFEYVMKPPYEGTAKLSATYNTPPSVLRPGDIIELTCSGQASESGKDLGAIGIGCGWNAEGSCEVLEGKKFFIGKASDGKHYPSGEANYKVKIGSGGKIVLLAHEGGFAWGEGAIWNPCEYTYEWNAPPMEESGSGEDEAGEDEEGNGATLTSTDPDDDVTHAIQAWLDPGALTLYAGEVSKIVNINIENFRTDTIDRVEVIFPQKTDNWASLPGQIVVNGGNGSYDPANMGRPVHADGYFFSARETAPGGDYDIDIIVQQAKAGFVRLTLTVHVVPKPARPLDPGATGGKTGSGGNARPPVPPPPPPTDPRIPQGDPSGPPADFAGRWTTNFGPVSLTQRGDAVEGTYPGGTIWGTVTGKILVLRMDERALSPFPGFGRWVLDAKGDAFEGGWSHSEDLSPPVRIWHGQRVTTGGASPHVMDPRGNQPTGGEDTPEKDEGDMKEKRKEGNSDEPAAGSLDLSSGNLASNGWNSEGPGGATVKVEGDQLIFDVPRESDGAAESFAAAPLQGDFDISVDYDLVNWKPGDDAFLSWSLFLSPVTYSATPDLIQVMRASSEGPGVVIVRDSSKPDFVEVPAASDRQGSIRIAREENVITVWQADGSGWMELAQFETDLPRSLHLGFNLERQGDLGANITLTPRSR